jgi:hypothetical protein
LGVPQAAQGSGYTLQVLSLPVMLNSFQHLNNQPFLLSAALRAFRCYPSRENNGTKRVGSQAGNK